MMESSISKYVLLSEKLQRRDCPSKKNLKNIVKNEQLRIASRWGGGGRGIGKGEGCVKIALIVSCSEWLTRLFLFIRVEFEIVQPLLEKGTHFLVTKVF